ncbi:MAG: hypothetical protein NTY07_10450 [Bacteroidia bacterium]|nr:hypothetical protein [Bacteroidia bacterium]
MNQQNPQRMSLIPTKASKIYASALIIAGCCFLFLFANKQIAAQTVKGQYETGLDFRKFLNPPAEFRSFPFYSINDSMDVNEISSQVREFKNAGFGGFYMHSRDGLLTEFLGHEWWTIMDAAVKAAQESGIQIMFYDEDKWPSGYAGGIIPRMGEDFRAKSLVRLKKETPLPAGSIVLKEDAQYKYIQHTAQMGNPIFNGTCWVDLFNPETVRQFLLVAYRPYIEKYSARIKNYHFAIFADEPHIHARYFDKATPNEGILSYSPWVAKKFRQKAGYDLLDNVNLLFEEKENWREVRLQYYRAVAEQFDESFTKQIAAYCEKNGVKFTGHYLGEDGLEKVRDRIGNSMLHYRSMQQPGIDLLGLSIADRLLTARSLSSVANQYAIPRRLTELFGISGQNMNFEDRKWIAGWHSILGINHFCPHLTLYSMKGLRKRDYPPTFSYQQPYWPYNKKIEDYMGRISYAATIGEYKPQILVLNPLESEYAKGNADGEFTAGVQNVMEVLQANHYDYDLGDEQIMADTASISTNKLVIGNMAYGQVILPDMISIRESTLNLLLQLHKNGGLIFSTGRFPGTVDGKTGNRKLEDLKNAAILMDQPKIAEIIKSKIVPHVILSGKDAATVWTQSRGIPNGGMILFYNTSHTNRASFTLRHDFSGKKTVLWNPSSGKCYSLKTNQSGKYELELAASEMMWITTGELSQTAQISGEYEISKPEKTILTLKNEWQGKRLAPNAITLDYAAYSTDNGKTFSESEPVIGIFNRLSDQQFTGNLQLRFQAQIDEIPKKCKLVLEQPNMYKSIQINGKEYSFRSDGFYVEHQFKTSEIANLLQKGTNTIQLELDFKPSIDNSSVAKERYGTEIESIYLTGDFAVTAHQVTDSNNSQRNLAGTFQIRPVHQVQSFSISAERNQFSGDVSMDGYPFYAGAFELKQSFSIPEINQNNKYILELPNCEAIVSVIELNGIVLDTLCWSPYKTDISKALKAGKNELKITMINSLRNLLGPHHNKQGELIKAGPNNFTGVGGFPDGRGDAKWYDLRKTSQELKTWTDTYNLIPFGLLESVNISESQK